MALKKIKCFYGNDLCVKFFIVLKTCLLVVLFLLPLKTFAGVNTNAETEPTKVIYETDMCADVDDVGGLAVLHAFANSGQAEILAVCFNEVHPSGAAAIDAINTWYKRGDIPIGVYKGHLDGPDYSAYLDYLKNFPHDLESSEAPSALDVYRQVLSVQPDSSVTIISVGFLNNLNDLLIHEPDLIAQKVQKLVIMCGINNDNFNLSRHNLVSVSQNVIENWPTPIYFSQAGWDILTGDNLSDAPQENPVREAYFRYFGSEYNGRPSWDQMAVLYGVTNSTYYFNVVSSGTGSLVNGYTWQMKEGFRSYLDQRLPSYYFENLIESLMDQNPIGAHFTVSAQQGWRPFTAAFDASGSVAAPGRTIQKYLWYFGDGQQGEGKTIEHVFDQAGEFVVSLTTVDDQGDSMQYSQSIFVYEPIFSEINFYGDVRNYIRNQEDLWTTVQDNNDWRYYLTNKARNSEIKLAGYCFVKDSIFSDFELQLKVRTGENLAQNKYANYTIIFGYQNDKNYNKLVVKASTSQLINVSNGQPTYLSYSSRKGIPDEGYHNIKINFSSSQLKVFFDDSLFLESNSSRLFPNGKIGFGSDKYAVFFDDIQIKSAPTSISGKTEKLVPKQLILWQNFPNPFNPATKLRFQIPYVNNVTLEIFSITGQKVRTLINEQMEQGWHEVQWDGLDEAGSSVPSGIYYARLRAGNQEEIIRMCLIK